MLPSQGLGTGCAYASYGYGAFSAPFTIDHDFTVYISRQIGLEVER